MAAGAAAADADARELAALVRSLADAQPAASLAAVCKTLDQASSLHSSLTHRIHVHWSLSPDWPTFKNNLNEEYI